MMMNHECLWITSKVGRRVWMGACRNKTTSRTPRELPLQLPTLSPSFRHHPCMMQCLELPISGVSSGVSIHVFHNCSISSTFLHQSWISSALKSAILQVSLKAETDTCFDNCASWSSLDGWEHIFTISCNIRYVQTQLAHLVFIDSLSLLLLLPYSIYYVLLLSALFSRLFSLLFLYFSFSTSFLSHSLWFFHCPLPSLLLAFPLSSSCLLLS